MKILRPGETCFRKTNYGNHYIIDAQRGFLQPTGAQSMERASTWAWDCQPPSEGAILRTFPINGSRPRDYPRRRASSRVHCIGLFDSGRVIDPIVLDGATLPERLHSGRDHRRVPLQPCEGNQSIFVTPTADHGVGVRRPSRWHADVARQIARRLLYGIDRQSPKPGLKGGSRGWIDLDTKDANDHRKTGERSRSEAGERTWALPTSSAPVFCILMLEGPLIGRHLFCGQPLQRRQHATDHRRSK